MALVDTLRDFYTDKISSVIGTGGKAIMEAITRYVAADIDAKAGALGATCFVVANNALPATKAYAQLLEAAGYPVWVCDGVADDVQLQAAIDEIASPYQGKIVLSDGSFVISATVDMNRNNSQLHGIWGSTELQLLAGANCDVLKISGAGVTIRDLWIDGNKANNTSGSGFVFDANQNRLFNCYAHDCAEYGYKMVKNADDTVYGEKLFACDATSNGKAGFYVDDCGSHEFVFCKANTNTEEGYLLNEYGETLFTECIADANLKEGFKFTLNAGDNFARVGMTNCWSGDNHRHGIYIKGMAVNFVISGGYVGRNGVEAANTYDNIYLGTDGSATSQPIAVSIVGVTFYADSNTTTRYDITLDGAEDCVIVGNNFYHNYSNASSGCIQLLETDATCQNNLISGNRIKNIGLSKSVTVTAAIEGQNNLRGNLGYTPSAGPVASHKTYHEDTGADEISIEGLAGAPAQKAAASGLASLDGSSKVVQDPANATATATASKIPIADGSAKLDGWISDGSTTVKGLVEAAIASEVDTGTDTARAVTPDALAGSDYGIQPIGVLVNDSTALTAGDGKAYFRIESKVNGWNVITVTAHRQAGTGLVTISIYNVTDSQDILSTALTIDDGDLDSAQADTPAVINATYDDVATADWIRIDVDGAGTGTTWLYVGLQLQAP